jgi:hypothetical protein
MPAKENAKARRTAAARELKKEREAEAFVNVLWVFGAALVLEAFLIAGYQQCVKTGYYSPWYVTVLGFGRYALALAAAGFAAAAAWRRSRRGRALPLARAALACAAGMAALACSWNGYGEETARALCVAVPISGLLLFVLFTSSSILSRVRGGRLHLMTMLPCAADCLSRREPRLSLITQAWTRVCGRGLLRLKKRGEP